MGWGGRGEMGARFCKHQAPPFAMQIDLFVAVMLERDEFFLSPPPKKRVTQETGDGSLEILTVL